MGQEYKCSVPRFKYLSVQLNSELFRSSKISSVSSFLHHYYIVAREKDHIIQILLLSSTHQTLIPVQDVAANQSSCFRIHMVHYNTEHGIPDVVNLTSKIS
jgi:hypothetical protein